jgi:DNA-binding NarL/FixJ family response regulator
MGRLMISIPAGSAELGLRILIVDDHQAVRRGVESIVTRHGLGEVCGEAENGEDAVRKVRELAPDLVTMDISMPVMNGLEATRQIRGIAPQTKIVVLTMHSSPQMLEQAKQAGADDVVEKFAAEAELVKAIRRFIA